MKNLKNGALIFLYFLIFPLQLTGSHAAANKNVNNPLHWLFVITSKQGEIKQNSQGEYELILKHTHIEQILAFSDRPNRIVTIFTPKQFKKLWSGSKNSFKKDPPNAIAVFGQKKIALRLMHLSVNENSTTFIVKSDDDQIKDTKMNAVSLFVDSYTSSPYCCTMGACCLKLKHFPTSCANYNVEGLCARYK